jgi:hypothetical protein
MTVDNLLHFVKPFVAMLLGAVHDYGKHLAVKPGDASQIEDAFFPERFQRVTENIELAFLLRVRRVEHDSGCGAQETYRNALTFVALKKLIRHAGPQHAVDPSFDDRWRLAPPVGVNDHDAVRRDKVFAMPAYVGWKKGFFRDLGIGHDRIKFLRVQIMRPDLEAKPSKLSQRGCGNGMIETIWRGMGHND